MTYVINPFAFASATKGALVYYGSNGSSGAGAAALSYDTESYDLSSWHDTGSNPSRLTAPVACLARCIGNFAHDGTASIPFRHRKGGSAFTGRGGSVGPGGLPRSNVIGAILSLTAGEYFELWKESASAITTLSATLNWLGVEVFDAAQKYALVTKTGTQALTGGAAAFVTFDSEVADTDAFHDNVTNNTRMTVPSGVTRVRVTGAITTNATVNDEFALAILKNNALDRGCPNRDMDLNAVKFTNVATAVLAVTAGDYFELRAFGTVNETLTTDCWFQIEEVPAAHKCCLAYKTTTQALTAGVPTIITFDAEVYDDDSIHDNVTNNSRFVCPSGCTEGRMTFGLTNSLGTGDFQAQVRMNGSQVAGAPTDDTASGSSDNLNGMGMWVPMSPGDYFEIQASIASSVNISNGNQTWACAEFR